MADYEIIHLQPDQWQRYKAIRLEALQNEPQAFSSTYLDNLKHPNSFWQGRLESAAQGDESRLLFAEQDGRLIGIVGSYVIDAGDTAMVISLYVSQDRRGKGVGRALMQALLNELSQQAGLRKNRLKVNASQTPAVTLYKQLGFQIVAEENSVMGDGRIYLEYVMEKNYRKTGVI